MRSSPKGRPLMQRRLLLWYCTSWTDTWAINTSITLILSSWYVLPTSASWMEPNCYIPNNTISHMHSQGHQVVGDGGEWAMILYNGFVLKRSSRIYLSPREVSLDSLDTYTWPICYIQLSRFTVVNSTFPSEYRNLFPT